MRKKALIGISILLILSMFAMAMMSQFQERFLFYPIKLPKDHQFRFDWPFEEWLVETEPGIEINALLFKSENPKGVVLYFHGNAGALDSWGYVAEDFIQRSYDILVVDYRGYGKSTGQLNKEADFHNDAAALYDKLKGIYKEEQIILYGRSMGTGVATKLAADRNPKKLILETPYYSMESLVRHYAPMIPAAILKYKLPTYQWLQEVKCPVHIIHGTSDEVIPYANASRLKDIKYPTLDFVTVNGGGHNNLSSFREFDDFLNRILQD